MKTFSKLSHGFCLKVCHSYRTIVRIMPSQTIAAGAVHWNDHKCPVTFSLRLAVHFLYFFKTRSFTAQPRQKRRRRNNTMLVTLCICLLIMMSQQGPSLKQSFFLFHYADLQLFYSGRPCSSLAVKDMLLRISFQLTFVCEGTSGMPHYRQY